MRRNLIWVLVQNVACNLVLIPTMGADGAAISGAVSAILLGALSVHAGRRVTGRLSLVRAFGGPALAGAAMAAVLLAVDPPLVLGVVLGAAVYLAGLAAWERWANPDDVEVVLSTIRKRDLAPAP
jgi:O-antigen/teichoic acid export membrane protein